MIAVAIKIGEREDHDAFVGPPSVGVEGTHADQHAAPHREHEMARHILQFGLSAVTHMFRDASKEDRFATQLNTIPIDQLETDIDHLLDGIRFCLRGAADVGFNTHDKRKKRLNRNNLDIAQWALKCLSRLCRLFVHQEDAKSGLHFARHQHKQSSGIYEAQHKARREHQVAKNRTVAMVKNRSMSDLKSPNSTIPAPLSRIKHGILAKTFDDRINYKDAVDVAQILENSTDPSDPDCDMSVQDGPQSARGADGRDLVEIYSPRSDPFNNQTERDVRNLRIVAAKLIKMMARRDPRTRNQFISHRYTNKGREDSEERNSIDCLVVMARSTESVEEARVAVQALLVLVTRNQAGRQALMQNENGIGCLLFAARSKDHETCLVVAKLLKELTVSASDRKKLKKHGGLIQLVRFTRPGFDQEIQRIASEACGGLRDFETPLDMHVWLARRTPPSEGSSVAHDDQLAIYLDSAMEGSDRLVEDTEHLMFVQQIVQVRSRRLRRRRSFRFAGRSRLPPVHTPIHSSAHRRAHPPTPPPTNAPVRTSDTFAPFSV